MVILGLTVCLLRDRKKASLLEAVNYLRLGQQHKKDRRGVFAYAGSPWDGIAGPLSQNSPQEKKSNVLQTCVCGFFFQTLRTINLAYCGGGGEPVYCQRFRNKIHKCKNCFFLTLIAQ